MESDYVVATYHVSGDGLSAAKVEKQALTMVNNAGPGTWTGVDLSKYGTDYDALRRKHGARLTSIHAATGTIRIAFPSRNFDPDYGGIPFLLNTVAGDILSAPDVSVSLLDLDLPDSFISYFPGPNLGVEGLRELLGISHRPLLAFSVKPRLGLEDGVFAKLCREAFDGGGSGIGVDICEDDTRLLSEESSYLARVRRVGEMVRDLNDNGNKLYSVNLTGRSDRVVERAKNGVEQGANALKIDVLAAGFPALQALTEYVREECDGKVPIFVYPAMYKLYERIERGVLLKLSRLAGADIVYAGTPEKVGLIDVIESAVTLLQYHETLREGGLGVRDTMPSVAGGLHPGRVEFVKTAIGHNDLAYFIGGGIAGHPKGIGAGAALFVKAIDAFHVQEKLATSHSIQKICGQ